MSLEENDKKAKIYFTSFEYGKGTKCQWYDTIEDYISNMQSFFWPGTLIQHLIDHWIILLDQLLLYDAL